MALLRWIVSSCRRLFRITARTTVENEVMAMASGSRRADGVTAPCVTCGMSADWTSRMWECDVCQDYFLCEDCHEGSLKDSDQMLPAPHQVHSREHRMSSHTIDFICDGCNSDIWKQRWRCKVCVNFDLCEVCQGGLGAADMPPEHSKEHEVVPVQVIDVIHPRFSKPVDPQWSYRVQSFKDSLDSGFKWKKRKPLAEIDSGFKWKKRKPLAEILSTSQMSVVEDDVIDDDEEDDVIDDDEEDDVIDQTPANAKKETNGTIPKLQKQITLRYRSLLLKEAPDTTQSQRMVDKKHKIFLSHAGTEKDFVEQLHKDLSKAHHFGIFFDKDDESLPKGKLFPSRIFHAASYCELAVVVISEEYFKREWPMLELATFVEAQKTRPELKILPVFYRLSVQELKKRQESIRETWSKMPSVSEDEVEKWKEAVRVICRTNGLEYDRKGEVAFRGKIVETVWKRVKPNLVWDVTHVQGKGRMQGMIHDKIQTSSNPLTLAPSRMGLYGMGGSGKTTMCMVIGNQMMQHYLGNVCLIEFGSTEVLQMRKKMLRSICRLDSSALLTVDEGQALTLLKDHIPEKKVCLILDNVSDDHIFFEEARTLLNLPFKNGSLILVTARSRIVLENLKIPKKATMKIPALSTVEANALFSQHARCVTTSLTEGQKKLMENFVERCSFSVEGMASKEYHPLALKVLGTRVGPHPEKWENIRINFKYYEKEDRHPIFSILRSSYDALNPDYQRMFLDIAIRGSEKELDAELNTSEFEVSWHMRFLYGETEKGATSEMLKVLQAKSLVEFYDAEERSIYVHDLYREFATLEVERKGLQHSPSCCFSRGNRRRRFDQEGRLRIKNEAGTEIRIDVSSCTTCSKAEYFSIRACPNLTRLDVSSMQSLRMFHVQGGCPELTRVDLGRAVNLQFLAWDEFVGEYPNITNMESLEVLSLLLDTANPPRALHGRLDFSRSSNLDTLFLRYLPLKLLNLNQAVQLRLLLFQHCQHLERFDGLEALVKLEVIALCVCSSLLEFPSLVNFPCLKVLVIDKAAKLKEMHGFAKLTGLVNLSLDGAKELVELPGIEACTGLTRLDLCDTSIGDCSWISMMKDLKTIDLSSTKIRSVPDCSGLTKLFQLFVQDCPALESVGSNLGIPSTFPDSLKYFGGGMSRSLKAVPQFSCESALEHLDMSGTCVEDLSSVMYCKHLRNLYVQGCINLLTLPDLGSCEELRVVHLVNSPLVDPNMVRLPRGSSKVI